MRFLTKSFFMSLLLVAPIFTLAGHHEPGEQKVKTIVGYDTTGEAKYPLYAGSLDTIEVWMQYMQAHDDADFAAIRAANAEDFKAWVADGGIIENTDAQIALLKDWFPASNPKWTHKYSIANEFTGNDGKLQRWVTTGWELTETENGKVTKRQEIFDVLIEGGKIKNIYIAAREIPEAE